MECPLRANSRHWNGSLQRLRSGYLNARRNRNARDSIKGAVGFYRCWHATTLVIEPSSCQFTFGHSFEVTIDSV